MPELADHFQGEGVGRVPLEEALEHRQALPRSVRRLRWMRARVT